MALNDKKCPFCGAIVEENEEYCSECGTTLIEDENPVLY